jgi:hypothetical protein
LVFSLPLLKLSGGPDSRQAQGLVRWGRFFEVDDFALRWRQVLKYISAFEFSNAQSDWEFLEISWRGINNENEESSIDGINGGGHRGTCPSCAPASQRFGSCPGSCHTRS